MSEPTTKRRPRVPHQKQRELDILTDPLVRWLNENGHMHMKIIIEVDHIELVEELVGIPNSNHIK